MHIVLLLVISIHAPREGGDYSLPKKHLHKIKFQSTPPARGATSIASYPAGSNIFQSTPPARGATVPGARRVIHNTNFNPRPPRGGRLVHIVISSQTQAFQSTPPARGATSRGRPQRSVLGISIHAPREGGDMEIPGKPRSDRISIHAPREGGDCCELDDQHYNFHFNPRPPRGGRLFKQIINTMHILFQSTPPARGATVDSPTFFQILINFNPRPPRGGRRCELDDQHYNFHFNPRPPRGGRHNFPERSAIIIDISIHAPREGGDSLILRHSPGRRGFQSTPPARGATWTVSP